MLFCCIFLSQVRDSVSVVAGREDITGSPCTILFGYDKTFHLCKSPCIRGDAISRPCTMSSWLYPILCFYLRDTRYISAPSSNKDTLESDHTPSISRTGSTGCILYFCTLIQNGKSKFPCFVRCTTNPTLTRCQGSCANRRTISKNFSATVLLPTWFWKQIRLYGRALPTLDF